MGESRSTLTRHDLEAKIVRRCWEDEAFRQEFTADPAGTTAKYLGVPAAGLPKIVVHQEAAGSWYIVLPPPPANINKLSEQELESVSGASATRYTEQITASLAASLVTLNAAMSATKEAAGW